MTTIVTLTKTGRQYEIGAWSPVGTKEENEFKSKNRQCFYTDHFGDFIACGYVIRNGKAFGRIRYIFKSEVTE